MGVMLAAAGSLQWYRDNLAPELGFEELVSEAAGLTPGSEGLVFLPYLSGERTPHPDPLARGAWVGLTLRHTRAHLTRSVLEGVAFGIRDIFELIREAGLGEILQVRVSGGGARSALWRQVLADVLAVPLVTVNTTEGAAYGAALLAAVGAGLFLDVPSACQSAVQITGQTEPAEGVTAYQEIYPRYRALYPVLKDEMHRLSSLV
jgi:xylulokinase